MVAAHVTPLVGQVLRGATQTVNGSAGDQTHRRHGRRHFPIGDQHADRD